MEIKREKVEIKREKEDRRERSHKKPSPTFVQPELADDLQRSIQCPVPGCPHRLSFNGATIKLFPLDAKGCIDWQSQWNLKWKGVKNAEGKIRWAQHSNPMKSVKRALERHYKRYHPEIELPFCVNKQVTLARVVEAPVSERAIEKGTDESCTDESYQDQNSSESSDDSDGSSDSEATDSAAYSPDSEESE